MNKTQKARWFIFPGMVAVFALALTPFFTSKAYASPPKVQVTAKPNLQNQTAGAGLIEKVGLYVLGISDLDVAAGSYSMDMYLNFKCNQPCNTDPGNIAFDVMNATGDPDISEQTSDTQGNTIHYYRVRVPLADNLNLRDFPFDYHHLSMQIEDKIYGTSDLNYEFDPEKSGVDDYAVVSGWEVQRVVTAEVLNHDYHIYSEPYSRLVFRVAIYHPWFSSFIHEGLVCCHCDCTGGNVIIPNEVR